MRILLVSCACPPFHGGGVAGLIDQVSTRLAALGHSVAVFTQQMDPRKERGSLTWFRRPGYDVAAVNLTTPDFLDRYRVEDYLNPATHEPFRRVVEQFRPEIIHFHAIQALGAGLLDWVPRDVPTVLTMHDFWWICPNIFLLRLDDRLCGLRKVDSSACAACLRKLTELRPPVNFKIENIEHRLRYLSRQLRKFSKVLAVSRFLRNRLRDFLPDVPIEVCENGLDLSPLETAGRLQRSDTRPSARRSRRVRFGFVGGVNDLKGYGCLLKAVSYLRDASFEVHVYGCRAAWLRRLASRVPGSATMIRALLRREPPPGATPLDPRIRLQPPYSSSDWPAVQSSVDVALVPSIVIESFSLVCREALVVGVPVIASRCGGPEEVVRHEVNGLLCEPNNSRELALCMSRCLEDDDLLSSLRANARADGIRTIDQQVEQLVSEYRAAGAPP
jgi:O-antigen biosynthesis protein